jgi:hypothetical protein
MAFETKNFFNSTIKQIYQQTGAILSLSTRSDKQLLINSLKLFEANFVYNWQKIHYPLLHGPTGSPYEKYTGMRSKPWAEYDALDSVYGGLSGWTLTAEPWATEDSIPALWDVTNKQPHSITGALYYLSQRIEDLTVENDEAELPQYDDREVKADIDCLEKNLETIYKDVYGCAYNLDCDGGKQNQFSVQTHLYQMFDQLIDGGPQFSIDDNCEDLYPAMSIYMPTSGLTYDVKIPNTEISGTCGNNLQDDLNLIHSYIGLNNCETSPTYSDYGSLNYLTDGNSLEESLWDLDNAISTFSSTKTLFQAYQDGWLDANNSLPGLIHIKDNANKANASEGLKIVHPRTSANWNNPSGLVSLNNNLGTVFEDDLLEVKDEAISGSNYIIDPLTNSFGNTSIDRWFKHMTVGEHEVGRKAQVALPNPLKYGDFIYPSFHIYRSVFNQMPTSGIPRTRASTQAYDGYTSHLLNETAIWVSTGRNRSGTLFTDPSYPPAGIPYDCDGNIVSEDNLYYRQPGDGTIYLLNKCGMTVQTNSGGGSFTWGEDAPNGAAAFHFLDSSANNGYSNSELMFANPDGNGLTIGWGGVTDTADDTGAVTANTLVVQEHYEGDINKASIEVRSRETGSKEVISFTHGNFGSVNENASIAASATGDFEFIANGDTRDIVFKPDNTESLRLYSNGNANFSGDVLVSGGLVVNGTTTTINSTTLQVDDKNIELGTVDSPTDVTADGGGITLKAANDKTITWSSATNAWVSNVGLHSYGALSTEGALTVNGAISTQSTIKLGSEASDEGKIRYNASSNEFEGNNGTSWGSLGSGGGGGINNIVEDTSPQLGGDLDANGNDIDMGTNVITDTAVGQWNTAYGWGDHGGAGYLTSLGTAIVDADFGSNGLMKRTGSGSYASVTDNSANWDTAYGWGDHSTAGYSTTDNNSTYSIDAANNGSEYYIRVVGANGGSTSLLEIEAGSGITLANGASNKLTISASGGGGSGTVTSVTPDADTGTGTAITTSGSITIAGGENVQTSVSGTTVTIDAVRTFGSIGFDMNSGDTNPGRNIHSTGNLSVFNETQIQLIRSGSVDNRVQFNVEKGYSVGDVITITNNIEGNVYFEAVAVDTFSSSPTLQSKFQGYYPAESVGGNSECQFNSITSTSLNTYEIIVIAGNSTIKLYCSDVTSGSATFEVYKA